MEYRIYEGTQVYYEWGRNCATLGLSMSEALDVFEKYASNYNIQQYNAFLYGWDDGPRDFVYSLPSF